MVAWPGTAGVTWAGRGNSAGFAVPMARAAGNQLPGITGAVDQPFMPGPGPYSGGQLGGTGDGSAGSDPRADKMQPYPQSSYTDSWSEGQVGTPGGGPRPPLPYGGTGSYTGRGWGGQTGLYGGPDLSVPDERQSFRRNGVMGWNDKLTVKDRHGYWDTGNQRTGTGFLASSSNPNAYNNPLVEPPRPDFRLVNRTVSYQKGSDKTRNQDDLSRPYTWLGEQGSGWIPVYGGVPGLYQPYGSRGGYPYPIVAPVEQGAPGDGPHLVFAGPPHGLHSQTPWKGGAQIISRFMATPQTRPVRQDRPANSPQAGQSYSQTVLPQGASRVRPGAARPRGGSNPSTGAWPGGRGWGGQTKPGQGGGFWLPGRGGR